MRLTNLGSDEKNCIFSSDEDAGHSYFSRYVQRQDWAGEPLYWMVLDGPVVPPLEFMFGANGRLSSLSVCVAGNLTMRAAPPRDSHHLKIQTSLPRVDLAPWKEKNTNCFQEKEAVDAWWIAHDLWVVRARKEPHSLFDTNAGMQVVFDEQNDFIGIVLKALTVAPDIFFGSILRGYQNV